MFSELVERSTTFTLEALRKAEEEAVAILQTSAGTPSIRVLQMVQLQKAFSAVGMFSVFEAMLQDGLGCSDGFREARAILEQEGETALKVRFSDLHLAVNVLKHGRGPSYDSLIAKADRLPFRVKQPGEAFLHEGHVAEAPTLIEVDDAFVLQCAEVIRRVSLTVQKARPPFHG